jgi:hypothetical protein
MVEIIGGQFQRIDINKGGTLRHRQEVNRHMTKLRASIKGITGLGRGEAQERRVLDHRPIPMPDTRAMTSGRGIQGHS